MKSRRVVLFLSLACFIGPAGAQTKFDPRLYQAHAAGTPTQILVLGTLHLGELGDDWDPATLAPLLDRLAAFDPDVIAIENIDGMAIEERWQDRAYHGATALRYGRNIMLATVAGRVGTGLGIAEAAKEARSLLEKWPKTPAPEQRRHLAALFATAGDPYSALVQWRSLAREQRTTGDGVRDELRDQLNGLLDQRNESSLLASVLAQRLGLNRVYPMDSQGEDIFSEADFKVFVEQVFPQIGKRFAANPQVAKADSVRAAMRTSQDLLDVYRMLNDAKLSTLRTDLEWLGMIDHNPGARVGRERISGWETRNLRMAANIREASGTIPGGRVLVVVGAAHKPWLEAYLGMMSDARIIDAEAILR
jgi:hypothetical protein